MSEPKIAALKPEVLTLEPGTYYWCACGASATQPFCNIVPVKFDITETTKVAMCNCKHTGTKPFCDGTHKSLNL